jgi:hypothetical protein
MPALAISKRLEVFSHREEFFWARLSLSIDCFGFVASISVAPVLVGIEYNFAHPSRRCQFPDTDLRVYTPVEIRRSPDETLVEAIVRWVDEARQWHGWQTAWDLLADMAWFCVYVFVLTVAWLRRAMHWLRRGFRQWGLAALQVAAFGVWLFLFVLCLVFCVMQVVVP